MGVTGTGKSTFISNVVGRDTGIGHDIRSSTKQIQEFETTCENETVFLVDTPGFDDSDVPDVVILKRISDWLKKRNIKESAIVGVIYLHKINDYRMSGSAKRNLSTFQALCGEGYSPRILIVTTHWADKNSPRHQFESDREATFRDGIWKKLIGLGAQIDRLEFGLTNHPFPDNTIDPREAKRILNIVVGIETETKDLQFRDEVVRQKKRVKQTTAGNFVEESINERIVSLEEELTNIKDDEQARDLREELRLLRLNRAKLQGNFFGILRYSL